MKTPVFLAAANLKPFIREDLTANLKPILFRPIGSGNIALGYRAELLPQVCNVFFEAMDAGVLRRGQFHIAQQCKVLLRGFAVVGINALVDEATGYQADRARDALAKILEAFIAKELRPWVRTFQPEFYRELFRLKGIEFTGTLRGPRHIAQATNDIVYRRLAPGVLDELNRLNPTNEKGQRRHKHFQWLTQQVGYQKLLQHLAAVTALMRVFDDFDAFRKALDRALPAQTPAPLFDPPKDAPPAPEEASQSAP